MNSAGRIAAVSRVSRNRRTTAGTLAKACLASVVGLVGVVGLAGCRDNTEAKVSTAAVVRQDISEVVDAAGAVSVRGTAVLSAPAAGRLAHVNVRPGQRVRAGTILGTIDSPTAQARLDAAGRAVRAAERATPASVSLPANLGGDDASARAAFKQARASARKIADADQRRAVLAQIAAAETSFTSTTQAADRSAAALSQSISDMNATAQRMGEAQQEQARQAYEAAKAVVKALTLRTPIAGVVQFGGTAAGASAPGNITDLLGAAGGAGGGVKPPAAAGGVETAIGVGTTLALGVPVMTVVDDSQLGLVVDVDETDVMLVHPGIKADVELDAAPGNTYQATVSSVDLLPASSTRGAVSYKVRLTLADPTGGAPRPHAGMSASTHLTVRHATNALTVPASALINTDHGQAVWQVRNGVARQVPVTVGVQGEQLVEVRSGLGDGDQVVVRGTAGVKDGQRIS